MEIMIATITLSVIAGLAFSNYQKISEQANCRAMQNHLIKVHSLLNIQMIKNNDYNGVDLSVLANPQTSFTGGIAYGLWPDHYFVRYSKGTPGAVFQCEITHAPLSSTNPTCTSATYCPSVLSP